MKSVKVNLLEINTDILSLPAHSSSNSLVQLLELEDSSLGFLCPLAKAIYLIETGRSELVDASEALLSCLAVDYKYSGFPGSDEHATISEDVTHVIEKKFCGITIVLGFESTGTMTHYSDFWSEYVRLAWGTDWPLAELEHPTQFIEKLFNTLDANVKESSPDAYPTDKGEFLGNISYKLKTINDIEINGPEYENNGCDDDWTGLSDKYSQRVSGVLSWGVGIDIEGQMSWLHYLNSEQAEHLGIAAFGDDAIGESSDYPEWVPKSTSKEDLESTWISPDELQKSYSSGKLDISESTEAVLAFGCGSAWDITQPGEEGEQDDELSADMDFNPLTPPLIEVTIKRGDRILPHELMVLEPYLAKFDEMLGE